MVDDVQAGNDPTRQAPAPLVQELAAVADLEVRPMEPMRGHTTFGIGGPVSAWVDVASTESISTVLQACQQRDIPVMMLGGGSNVLFDDEPMDLVVLHPTGRLASMQWHDEHTVTVGAGCSLAAVMNSFRDRGLSGLAWAAGVPGTVGGALWGNAGAAEGAMADSVVTLEVVDDDGRVRTISSDNIEIGYRRCRLPQGTRWITRVTLRGGPAQPEQIRATMQALLERRRITQPTGFRSAGCVFRNPPDGPSAGALVDRCGMKGLRIGDAEVSTVHANFIVNRGSATAAEVRDLMAHIVRTVRDVHGVTLHPEIVLVPGDRFEEVLP